MTVADAVLLNALYELEAWCTSIVVQMKNGTIIHARNLDFDNPDVMRSVTYRARYFKNGKLLYNAVMFAGNVGVYTAMKPGAFSISENERFPEKSSLGFFENLFMMFAGYEEISWLVRKTAETCDDFECAYKALTRDDINALGYLILAGTKPNEGVVISRNRYSDAHIDRIDAENGKWFVVQTNSDHWKDGCVDRCAAATDHLNEITQENINI